MSWLVWALLAHAGNGLVFIFDKGILGSDTPLGQPWRLAYYSGLVSGVAGILLVWEWIPLTPTVAIWSLIGGACFVVALWCFFMALQVAESSRVVPLIGSAVAVWTWLLAAIFLGETLRNQELVGVILLIAGGIVLSVRLTTVRGLSTYLLGWIVVGGLAFAAYFTIVKYIYMEPGPFLGLFAYSRLGVMVAAVMLFGPRMWREGKQQRARRRTGRSLATQRWLIGSAFVTSKILGAGAFVLQNYAIRLGSVTVVNALQGVQYGLVLVLAGVLSRKWSAVWGEEWNRLALVQKLAGIAVVSYGFWLLV